MKTSSLQHITAGFGLLATLMVIGISAAPHRLTTWMRTSRSRGDVVGFVIIAAGVAAIGLMIVAYLTPKVQEYLNRIQ